MPLPTDMLVSVRENWPAPMPWKNVPPVFVSLTMPIDGLPPPNTATPPDGSSVPMIPAGELGLLGPVNVGPPSSDVNR